MRGELVRRLPSSGPDAFGDRRVLPGHSGAILLPPGTCPGCRLDSHPGVTCDGRTTEEVIRILWPGVTLRDVEDYH